MYDRKSIFLSTIVWGDNYIEIFCEYTLKSLLTKKNLLNKRHFKKITFLIYTEKKNYLFIKKNPNLIKLSKAVNIIFKEIYLSKNRNKYKFIKKYQNESIKIAKKMKGDLYSFIYPDSVFGENHFDTLLKKINQGYKAVMCPGPLVIFEKFVDHIRLNNNINNKSLASLTIKHLHPFYEGLKFFDTDNNIFIYENESKNNLIVQGFHLHIAIISLNLKNLIVKKTYDEDLILNSEIKINEIDYINSYKEGILITLENFFSGRPANYYNNHFSNKQNDVFVNKKIFNKSFNDFYISNYLMGTFVVSKKNDTNDAKKKFDSLLRKNITKCFTKKEFSSNQKKFLNDFLHNRHLADKINIQQYKQKVGEWFILKKIMKSTIHNENIFSRYLVLILLVCVILFKKTFLYVYKKKEKIKQIKNPIISLLIRKKHIFLSVLKNNISIPQLIKIYFIK